MEHQYILEIEKECVCVCVLRVFRKFVITLPCKGEEKKFRMDFR